MQPTSSRRAAFAFVFVAITLDMLALGIVAPVLPGLVVAFEGGNVSRAARITGWFGFIGAAMQFFAAPLLGVLSDRFGRRPVLLLSLAGMGADYVLMALAPSLPWLFAGRVISGITSAAGPTAVAYVADITPPGQRAARFGLLEAAFGLGFVAGPAIGGLLGALNLRLPFWGAALLCLGNAVYGFFILPESLSPARRVPFSWRRAHPLGALRLLQAHPALAGLAVAVVLTALAHAALPNVIVLYMSFRYGWDQRAIGLAVTAIGASAAAVSLFLVGTLARRLGDRATLLAGLACGGAGFVIYGLADRATWFLAGIPVMALWGLASPAMQASLSRRVGPSEQGRLQGAVAGLRGITGMVGPLFFGWVFARAIDPAAATRVPGAPFFIAATALGLAGLVAAWATAPRRETFRPPGDE